MKKRITYKTSGVNIDQANNFIKGIKGFMGSTMNAEVLNMKGAFGGLFSLNVKKYKNPVLVSSSDGVGTKLLIAQKNNIHNTVGIDLVAMNVNDILCVGAKPLFFLDYIACGKLNPEVLKSVVSGIAKGCRQSECSLIGGETAEMPDMYKKEEYDLAGFAVGVVEKKNIITGTGIKAGDKILGLPSSGLHSNGFSLVRKVFNAKEQNQLSKELLKPTKIYVKEVLPVIDKFKIQGIAHITGGAFYDKLTKVLPKGKCFYVDKKSWKVPKIFRLMQEKGNVDESEMYRTFNMGIGLVLVVRKNDLKDIKSFLLKRRVKSYEIGEVINNDKKIILS